MTKATSLDQVADVDIDPSGVFKYIQVQVTDKSDTSKEKTIVRGYGRHGFHAEIFDEVKSEQVDRKALKVSALGGGRIRHEPAKKDIFIYGYSQAYGPAKHELSKSLIEAAYPGYTVSFSYDGY